MSGLGLVHGIGHALTAHTGAPHGVALAAVLDGVREISGTIGVERPLRARGADRAILPGIAACALVDPVTRNTPLPPTEPQIRGILTTTY